MRFVFIGAGEVTLRAADDLIAKGHEVVIVDRDEDRIRELSEDLDCSFLHGDGATPSLLEEAGPEQTDILFCLSDSDQANVIASLVGKSLGFRRVVTSISNSELEPICSELQLENTIVPGRAIARQLLDIAHGLDNVELSTILKGDARFFSFTVAGQDAGAIDELDLPERSRVVFFYRDEGFCFAEPDGALREGDEVVILTDADHLGDLEERWHPRQAEDSER